MRTWHFAQILLAFAWVGHAMSAPRAAPRLFGECVTLSYVADPHIGYGRFRLENQDAGAITVSVRSVWLQADNASQPLGGAKIFDTGKERVLNPSEFHVDGAATLSFVLGFPRIPLERRFGQSVAVGLRLRANGEDIEALSPIKFVRRLPRGA